MKALTQKGIIIAAAFMIISCSGGNGQLPIDYWFVDSLVKVFPQETPGKNQTTHASVEAARNGHVSVQLALRSPRLVNSVDADVEWVDRGAQNNIKVQVRYVGYVNLDNNTPKSPKSELVHSAPGLFPDVLYEKFPFTLKPNTTQAVWLTFTVPNGVPPGDYKGAVVVREKSVERVRAPFDLRVVAATVPPQTLRVTNWFYLSNSQLQPFYGVSVFSEGWWKLLGRIGHVLAEHHQNMIATPLTGFYFSNFALIQARVEKGSIVYDFSRFDRWVKTFQDAGLIGYIEGGHVLRRYQEEPGSPVRVQVYVNKNGKAVLEDLSPDTPRAEVGLRSMLKALYNHLKEKGWQHIYYQHVLDEVRESEMPVYVKYSAIVHSAMPGIQTMDAVSAHRDLNIYEKSCNVWVPVLGSFDNLVSRLHEHVKRDGSVWFYTCMAPVGHYPNRFIDYSLVKVRLLQWINFRYDLTGFLHWGGDYWSSNPVKDTQPKLGAGPHEIRSYPGDGFIVYPDPERRTILSSIRLEQMMEGIEDYGLLEALNRKNHAEANRIAGRMVHSFTDYVRDPVQFRSIQKEVLEALSEEH
jgi:Glycoside hydrolase 123, catalytic domain/Glycoside hydrolase 123 N-terminal domain